MGVQAEDDKASYGSIRGIGTDAQRLIAAIRRFTVDSKEPNGPAERAIVALQVACESRDWNAVNDAAGDLCEALAADTRELRIAAEAYFGGDFRKPT